VGGDAKVIQFMAKLILLTSLACFLSWCGTVHFQKQCREAEFQRWKADFIERALRTDTRKEPPDLDFSLVEDYETSP
jgi:hypothetical protein